MAISLINMSRKELLKLKSDVEKALKAAEKTERVEARKAAEKAAAKFGFSLDELTGKKRAGRGSKSAKAAAKYRNPKNGAETWSGRGRKPRWIHAALESGASLDDLAI